MSLPDIGRYRRRFIVEFGPEDSGLVDRMGEVHRTKRAAIIAGLRLLDSGEIGRLTDRVAALEADLAAARTGLEMVKAAAARQSEAAREAKPAAAAVRADLRTEREAHAKTRAELAVLVAANTEGRQAYAALAAERQALADALPHHAYCGYCDKLVPEAEWAEKAARRGFDVYHKPDGYRAKGSLVGGPATVLFWRENTVSLKPDGSGQ